MDTRRFDAITRAWSARAALASRRRLVQALPGLAVGSLLPGPDITRALDAGDAGDTTGEAACPPTGRACTGAADCAPGEVCVNGICQAFPAVGANGLTPTPAAPTTPAPAVGGIQVPPDQALSVAIYPGVCGQLPADPAFQLVDIDAMAGQAGTPPPAAAVQGPATAIPARFSTSVIDADLADLLAAPHAIDVRLDAADPGTSIVCGDIGGQPDGPTPGAELAIGLAERGASNHAGIGFLREEGERLVVNVFVAPGLAGPNAGGEGTADAAAAEPAEEIATIAAPAEETAAEEATTSGITLGATVITTADVNLRAAPSTDAVVVDVLPPGVSLTVTASPADGWVPVQNPTTGQRGYVTEELVAPAE